MVNKRKEGQNKETCSSTDCNKNGRKVFSFGALKHGDIYSCHKHRKYYEAVYRFMLSSLADYELEIIDKKLKVKLNDLMSDETKNNFRDEHKNLTNLYLKKGHWSEVIQAVGSITENDLIENGNKEETKENKTETGSQTEASFGLS